MAFLKLTEQNVQGKTVLIRADMNVPFKDGKISDDTRIRASLASIKYCRCRTLGQPVGQRRESIERLA